MMHLVIRLLKQPDIAEIAAAFQQPGWDKPASQYERYFDEQTRNIRDIYVAFMHEKFAGYLTICWTSTYPPFREANIPEIVDFNVLPQFRRQHIGTSLMDKAESEIAKVSATAGTGVGLTPDYGAARRNACMYSAATSPMDAASIKVITFNIVNKSASTTTSPCSSRRH